MTDMVERVALALFDCTAEEWAAKSDHFRKVATADVRRAIEAMREPTEAMVNLEELPYSPGEMKAYWCSMIDAALK